MTSKTKSKIERIKSKFDREMRLQFKNKSRLWYIQILGVQLNLLILPYLSCVS